MRIDVRAIIKNYEGKKMNAVDENEKSLPLTVRRALNFVINGIEMAQGPHGQQVAKVLTAEEKGRIYQLSTKLWAARKEVKFTPDEVTFLRVRAGNVVNITPLIYGRVCDLLEGKHEKETDEKPKAKGDPGASAKRG